jgi:hypothetical protein
MVDTLFDAVKELHIRMLSGETLEEAKRCLKYQEDLSEDDKKMLNGLIQGLNEEFGADEFKAVEVIYNCYSKGSM